MSAKVRYYDIDRENTNALNLKIYGSYNSLSDVPGDTLSGQFLLDNYDTPNYLSFDGNGIDLKDKNKKFYSEGDYVGYISGSVSDSSKQLGNCGLMFNRKSTESFSEFKKGITFVFYGNCCSKMYAMYRNGNTEAFLEEEITVGKEIFTFIPSSEFAFLELYFTETVLPYQSVKLSDIKIGKVTVLDKLQNIELLEEINVLSDDLPINSLNFTAVIKNGNEIKSGNPVTVHSNQKYYGTFYIDEIERIAENIYSVKALNSIKILDKAKCLDWHMGADFSSLSNMIKIITGITVGTNDYNCEVFGHLPIESCRYALCMYAFACRLMIDSSRSNQILLKPIPAAVTSVITSADRRIIGDSSYTRNKAVKQSKIQYAVNYTSTDETLSVKCTPEVKTVIYTERPVLWIDETATDEYYVSSYMDNWIEVTSHTDNAFSITVAVINYTYQNETVNNILAEENNEKDFSKLNLRGIKVNADGTTVQLPPYKKQDILKYMQSTGTVKTKIRLRNERVGDLIQIETAYDGLITGIITSMNISFGYEDLADIEVLEWQNG